MPPADTRRVVSTCIETLCLHVLSSFQRTGCLTRRLLRVSASSSPCSPTAIFPSGEPFNLTERFPNRQPFSPRPFDFLFEVLSRPPHPIKATHDRCRLFRALEVRLGSGELKEVFRLALPRLIGTGRSMSRYRASSERLVMLGSTQYTLRFRGCQLRQMPELQTRQNPRN